MPGQKSESNLNPTKPVMKVKHLLQLDVLLKGISPEALAEVPEKSQQTGLERLLTLSRMLPPFKDGGHAWLCRALGIPRQQDDPVAPYAAQGDGLAADDGYWLCADPVHLHLARDRIVLREGALPDVTEAEAAAVMDTLNAHFSGMQFFAPHPRRWYIRLPASQNMVTTPLDAAIGQDVGHVLPTGTDAKTWIVWQNELQMLLHEHPVNEARSAAGKLPVNSLWLWGGGVRQPVVASRYTRVWGDAAMLAGTAAARSLPPAADTLLDGMSGRELLVLDVAEMGWQILEQQWFAPLEQALKRGRLARLDFHIAHGDRVSAVTVRQRDVWKWLYQRFMRRTSLADILHSTD